MSKIARTSMNRVFGIETEYGITVDGADDLDVVRESIEIVRSYTEHGASMKWDYDLEDPHQDARGFRAEELLQDTDEAAYFELDRDRPLSFEEIKSDLVLSNGARFYNDHAHPEYSTPECSTLRELVAQDQAGERILAECARRRNTHLPPGCEARLYKNNTDFVGHSYGCHDNYLMRRDVPWDALVRDIVPFLVTRQIFAGAGKMGVEGEDARWVLAEWERILDDLALDYWRGSDRLDWVAKKFLLHTLQEAERLAWTDPWLQAIDLEYHNIALDCGLHYELLREGRMRRIVSEDDIRRAIFYPPETTRAYFRGRAVAKFHREIETVSWDAITFAGAGERCAVTLPHPSHDAALTRKNDAMREARGFSDLVERLRD